MEAFLDAQGALYHKIDRGYVNMQARGSQYVTVGAAKVQMDAVTRYWNEYQKNHYAMRHSPQADLENGYFRSDILEQVENAYLKTLGQLQDVIERLSAPPSPIAHSSSIAHVRDQEDDGIMLEKITIPPFSGRMEDWSGFKDLFKTLVIDRRKISDGTRLHFLRTKVMGEAYELIKNIELRPENFAVAWKKLEQHYENMRRLVNIHLTSLLSIKAVTAETSAETKRLLEGTLGPLAALRSLGRPCDHWDDIIVFLTFSKLSPELKREWENHLGNSVTPPKFKEMEEFLLAKVNNLKNLEDASFTRFAQPASVSGPFKAAKLPQTAVKAHQVFEPRRNSTDKNFEFCGYCKKSHPTYACEGFKQLDLVKRYEFANLHKLCYNCLRKHRRKNCTSKYLCLKCNKRHHTLMHADDFSAISHLVLASHSDGSDDDMEPGQGEQQFSSTGLTLTQPEQSSVHLGSCEGIHPSTNLLATASVVVENSQGQKLVVRALVDPCSQASFVASRIQQFLRLPSQKCALLVEGMNDAKLAKCNAKATFLIRPHFLSKFSCEVGAYVSSKITNYSPMACKTGWTHFAGLQLADPQYLNKTKIEILLGVDVYSRIIQEGVKRGSPNEPIALKTELGWLISGSTHEEKVDEMVTLLALNCNAQPQPDLSELLRKFWLQEEIDGPRPESPADVACESIYANTVARNCEGRYIVTLPFKPGRIPTFEKTLDASIRLLYQMEKRFQRDQKFKTMYHAFMQDYLDSGHMSLVGELNDIDFSSLENYCFLPHHGVLKESSSTTKLRTVFNGSYKADGGVSLNDCLYTGKNLLPKLATLLMNWRKYRFAFTADIKQMFRQILVDEPSQNFQLIVWRFDELLPILVCKLLTLVYGVGPSPFEANRTVRQLASDEKETFPLGAEILEDQTYMDDVTSGGHSKEEAEQKVQQVREICKVGGFELRKWLANDPDIIRTIPEQDLAAEAALLFEEESRFSILGMSWQPNLDNFQFIPSVENTPAVWTKRKVASKIAQLFDPLGLLGPVIVSARIVMKDLWRLKLEWDVPLPSEQENKWHKWYSSLEAIGEIKIPRWIGYTKEYKSIQLHGFADASLEAYGAAIYLRVESNLGIKSQLIVARSKVSPMKVQTIPKLELLAARLLAEVAKDVIATFVEMDLQVTLWTDSKDVLHWLDKHPSEWEIFVANRCSQIMDLVPETCWKHVPTDENPADLISRGVLPSELKSLPLWWDGPSWLKKPETEWNKALMEVRITRERLLCHQTAAQSQKRKVSVANTDGFLALIERRSSLLGLLRVTAYVLRFVDRLYSKFIQKYPERKRDPMYIGEQVWFRIDQPYSEIISTFEVRRARLTWVYLEQREHFSKVFQEIEKGVKNPKHKLVKFDPIIDHGILRVGGRLKHSLLAFDQKHPILLPAESRLSLLIVRDCHARSLHGGTALTLNTVRQTFWILNGRQLVKKVIRKCIPCIRYRATENYQKMGNLPPDRVRPSRPFRKAGVDYAGPYSVSVAPGRGRATYKSYICIFVCLSTKAVHLELVVGYDSPAFIAAFRRFTARRGHCELLRSDQGTTLTGADKELQKMYKASSEYAKKLELALGREGTAWKFNPPAAPNFGGIWEAAVKSVKHHIRRVIGDTRLTYEEFATLLCQVEACLNSRPLLTLTDDPTDMRPLTPAHFLIQTDSYLVPEEDLLEVKVPAGRRWQLVQQRMQQIWKYWLRDYLQSLQTRGKWQTTQRLLQVDDMVLVVDETTPPGKWPLARITEVFPGDDGLPRVANVRLYTSEKTRKLTTLTRPVSKLILLIGSDE